MPWEDPTSCKQGQENQSSSSQKQKVKPPQSRRLLAARETRCEQVCEHYRERREQCGEPAQRCHVRNARRAAKKGENEEGDLSLETIEDRVGEPLHRKSQ